MLAIRAGSSVHQILRLFIYPLSIASSLFMSIFFVLFTSCFSFFTGGGVNNTTLFKVSGKNKGI
jgi:hypothetical protein